MVRSIFRKLLTELGIRTEDAECNLMGEMCNFANLVHIIKVVWVSIRTIPRQAINTPVITLGYLSMKFVVVINLKMPTIRFITLSAFLNKNIGSFDGILIILKISNFMLKPEICN